MILIENVSVHTLVDTRSKHFFISLECVDRFDRVPEQTSTPFVVSGSSGQMFATRSVIVGCGVFVGRETLKANLLVLPMIEFDVILGMD